MISKIDKNKVRLKRHARVRTKLSGTAEKPRLNVYRSNKHIYAQIIDDVKGEKLAQTFTSNYGKLAKDKGANITKVDGFNQSIDLLLSKRVDGTFNDSLSYLDYKKQKPNAKIKAIKGDAEQNKSAFAFSKSVDDKVISDFNDGLKKLKENGELAKIGEKWFGENVSEPK